MLWYLLLPCVFIVGMKNGACWYTNTLITCMKISQVVRCFCLIGKYWDTLERMDITGERKRMERQSKKLMKSLKLVQILCTELLFLIKFKGILYIWCCCCGSWNTPSHLVSLVSGCRQFLDTGFLIAYYHRSKWNCARFFHTFNLDTRYQWSKLLKTSEVLSNILLDDILLWLEVEQGFQFFNW